VDGKSEIRNPKFEIAIGRTNVIDVDMK